MRGLSGTTIGNAGLIVEPPDDFAGAALQHLDDDAFGPAALICAADAHGDAIAVHHFAHLSMRQNDRRRAIVRMQKTMAIAMSADGADDQRQSLAQAVFIASVAHQFARLHALLEFRGQAACVTRFRWAPTSGSQFVELQRAVAPP